jgi:acetyltransferase-like isoleucine patch superfamily enzyme
MPTSPEADDALPARLLRAHPAWPAGVAPGAGWSAPVIPALREIPLDEAHRAALEALGIQLRSPPGPGNRLLLDAATPVQRLALELSRASGFTLLLGRDAQLSGQVKVTGAGHLLAAAGSDKAMVTQVQCTFRGGQALVLLGRNLSSRGTDALAEGPGGAILVGDDGMISIGITIRTSDSHAIIDIGSRSQVNLPEPVLIGPHVWLAEDVLVMKGVSIGAGAIVAARAAVTRDVPARTLVAGVPARVLRENVTWTRDARPGPAAIEAVLRSLPPA